MSDTRQPGGARSARAGRSIARSDDERRAAVRSGERADRHEADLAGLDPGRSPHLHAAALAFHRDEQARHVAVGDLQQAYGTVLLDPATSGPALVLALGSVVGEVHLTIHLVGGDGTLTASGSSLGAASTCRDLETLFGEGPGTDAATSGATVVQALDASGRWPGFTAGALDAGVGAVVAVPLGPVGGPMGAVTIYSPDPDHLARATIRLVPHLSATLLELVLEDHARGTTLALGPDHLGEIHRASGMIAAQVACSLADALVLLRARAFVEDRTLATVARDTLAGRIAW